MLVCGSEGEASRNVAESSGWNYIEAKNTPLTNKHNALFAHARTIPHDAVLLIGSDDLISPEIIEYYQKNYTAECPDMIGFNTLHFYSIEQKKLIYFKGFLKDRTGRITMGAGRLFPKRLLENIDYTPYPSRRGMNRGLDTITSQLLIKRNYNEVEIDLRTIPGAMMLDIKSEISLTKFDRLLVNCEEQDVSIFENKFPLQYKQLTS